MESVPRALDMKASGVGMQVWKYVETSERNAVVGEQWAGSVAAVADSLSGSDMVQRASTL
jgi:hypothetical protein